MILCCVKNVLNIIFSEASCEKSEIPLIFEPSKMWKNLWHLKTTIKVRMEYGFRVKFLRWVRIRCQKWKFSGFYTVWTVKTGFRKIRKIRFFDKTTIKKRMENGFRVKFLPEWNLVPHSTAQHFLCCAVCCAVFENWILSAVKSCVITVQHFENCCEKVLYSVWKKKSVTSWFFFQLDFFFSFY